MTDDYELEKLVAFVEDQLQKGQSERIIRTVLVQNGQTPELVDDVFLYIKNPEAFVSDEAYYDRTGRFRGAVTDDYGSGYFFGGRIDRASYLFGMLLSYAPLAVLLVVSTVMIIVCMMFKLSSGVVAVLIATGIASVAYAAWATFMQLSLAMRRLHDFGLSGRWALLGILRPLDLVLFFLCAFVPGNVGVNEYGYSKRERTWKKLVGLRRQAEPSSGHDVIVESKV